ncbi:MAG TPA: HAD-IIIA family hydrolase [Chitinophagaceae bacterium]|nr:HAD-IIIA family hydrolase [Chitinophagaceae bacterium]
MLDQFLQSLDSSWTLFLDRDGVLNIEKDQDYIKQVHEFEFYPETPFYLSALRPLFQRIIVVTNQRGIGRNLMTENDLHDIHSHLNASLQTHGGLIDAFYYATSIHNSDPYRKPNTGMGLQAQKDFPEINFSKSIMVGNNISDMEFGHQLGMKTVFVETTKVLESDMECIDMKFTHFVDFCKYILQKKQN